MGPLTIIVLLCIIASFITTILVVGACMLSARISHGESLPEEFDASDTCQSLPTSISWSD
jgi:hypothetical protein